MQRSRQWDTQTPFTTFQEDEEPEVHVEVVVEKEKAIEKLMKHPKRFIARVILGMAVGAKAAHYTYYNLMKKSKSTLLKILASYGAFAITSAGFNFLSMKAEDAAFGLDFGKRRRRRSRRRSRRMSRRRSRRSRRSRRGSRRRSRRSRR